MFHSTSNIGLTVRKPRNMIYVSITTIELSGEEERRQRERGRRGGEWRKKNWLTNNDIIHSSSSTELYKYLHRTNGQCSTVIESNTINGSCSTG